MQVEEGPPDNGGVAYAIFMLLGVGILAPYNSMISAVDFFNVLYPGTHIESILSVRGNPLPLAPLSSHGTIYTHIPALSLLSLLSLSHNTH